jgi:single-strand DNA-binding protein
MNILTISGRLTRDPEIRVTASGDALAKFSVAVDNFGRDKGASFFDCVAFGKTSEYVTKYLTKGRAVIVTGRHESNKGSDGKTYWSLSVNQVEATDKPKDATATTTATTDEAYSPWDDQ